MIINPRLFNPLYWHIKPLLRDPNIRFIFVEGGSSAGKTFEICDALLIDMLEHNYSTMCFRRFQVHIPDSIYSSFKVAADRLGLKETFWHFQEYLIKSKINGARIRFRGLDDEENIKGIEDYNIIYNNEWSQNLEEQWSQQRKRLRGRHNQKFICDWNPISAKLWQYEHWIDLDEWTDLPLHIQAPTKYSTLDREHSFKRINKAKNAVWIKTTYRDNYWVVGHPTGKGGFVDQGTLDDFELDRVRRPNFYRVYANGERGIMRTGGEFWKQFDEIKHVKPIVYDPTQVIHITLDNNVVPYVTCSAWQLNGKTIQQVQEFPSKTPNNNAPKAAQELIKWLRHIEYNNVVYVYGDPSASARSTIDPNNASFFDKYIGELKNAGFKIINRVGRSAPQVSISAAFINDLYEYGIDGWNLIIGDNNKTSIDDYANAKEDKNGGMMKTRVTDPVTKMSYEPYGHFSDAKRYFLCSLLKPEFEKYLTKQNKYMVVTH